MLSSALSDQSDVPCRQKLTLYMSSKIFNPGDRGWAEKGTGYEDAASSPAWGHVLNLLYQVMRFRRETVIPLLRRSPFRSELKRVVVPRMCNDM